MIKRNTLIICSSVHHKNTMKIAEVIGEVLDAEIIDPKDFNMEILSNYDLIGFGSGIYNGDHHKSILNLATAINKQNNKKAFIFSTATFPLKIMHKSLKKILIKKEFDIIGHFCCKGFMNYSFTKYLFGGLNKGRPNDIDFKRAQDFAIKIKE